MDDTGSKIDISDSGRMLWIRKGDELLSVSGGEGDTTNILVANGDEASVDLEPGEVEMLTECLLAWVGRDVILVERETLNDLIAATTAAIAVLEVVNVGKPLRLALERLTAQVGAS